MAEMEEAFDGRSSSHDTIRKSVRATTKSAVSRIYRTYPHIADHPVADLDPDPDLGLHRISLSLAESWASSDLSFLCQVSLSLAGADLVSTFFIW
jgi:hypothetical protein